MTPKQLDSLFEQVHKLITERDTARAHVIRLQDELERVKSQKSTEKRKLASRRNGVLGGRPKKQQTKQ